MPGKICCQLIVREEDQEVVTSWVVPARDICDIDAEPLEQSVVNARIPVVVGCLAESQWRAKAVAARAGPVPVGRQRGVKDMGEREHELASLMFCLGRQNWLLAAVRHGVHAAFQAVAENGDGGPIRLLVFVRRLSWGAHVGQAEAAHCPLGAMRARKNGRFP